MPALPTKIDNFRRWDGGLSPYEKDAHETQYASGHSVNYRKNPRELTILPRTVKESGSTYTDLPVDGDRVGSDTYLYDQSGGIYKRTSAGVHTQLRTVGNSQGNGMHYYGEDDFLYYASNTALGRYGQMNAVSPTFVDDFLGAEGGVPLNTHSLDLEASSSQYASVADNAAESITGNLAMEATITPESLPTVGNSMVLASKWDINGNLRSYKFEMYAISGFFGDGSDGALTVSANTTENPIDSACTGTSGAYSLSATNLSFAAGQVIKIYQTQGATAGTFQKNRIVSYTAGTITLESALNATYTAGAQVRVLKQYTSVTVNAGITYTAKAWNGTVGGILAFLVNGTLTGTTAAYVSANGCGFRGGARGEVYGQNNTGQQGEGTVGTGSQSTSSNNGGGGGGARPFFNNDGGNPGAGGGYATTGANGTATNGATIASGGGTYGTADLTTLFLGTGGGGGGFGDAGAGASFGTGGNGGGIIDVSAVTISSVAGGIVCKGSAGLGASGDQAAGGTGSGGSTLLNTQNGTLGTLGIDSTGSGDGRNVLNYLTSYTGTATPTLNAIQDNNLVTTATYQLRLGLSSNGTNEEFLTKNSTVMVGQSSHVGVSWNASGAVAEFFQNGASLGTSVGAFTAINNNTSRFAVGCDFNNTARNFFDGLIDEVRIWNVQRTAAQMYTNKETQISVSTPGLAAYYQLNNTYDDSANINHLTASGSPVFSTTVAFSSPTTRLDIDQTLSTSGNTYTTPLTISETAANRQTFTPTKDPQKSIKVEFGTKGTGNVTLTVHDSVNRVVASVTVANASLPASGAYEFVFANVWRPVRGAPYHFHVTSTVADATLVTTTAADLETGVFTTFYQFLVNDEYHSIDDMLNFISIANERYVATYDATTFDPHRLVFPAGWRTRCQTKFREFMVYGCWKGETVGDFDTGMLFFWDGYSPTYNFAIPVPEGAVNAMVAERGVLHVFAGYQGEMIDYVGGDSAKKVRRLPKVDIGISVETLPKAVTMWQGLLRWGVAGACDSQEIQRAVYTYGSSDEEQPLSLSRDYLISSGNKLNTVQIGFLLAVNKKLLVGCKDGVSSWVDVIDPAGLPFATATVEKDIKDYGAMWKEKSTMLVRADFKPLAAGQTIKVKYKLDRASSWTESATLSTVGATKLRLPVSMGNHKEVQIACDLGATGSTSPTLLELGLEENLKTSEQIY